MNSKVKIIISAVILAIIFGGCTQKKEPVTKITFSGIVKSMNGDAISGAIIAIAEDSIRTEKDGRFTIIVDPSNRYVLNITKAEFGLISKVYHNGITNKEYLMTPATVAMVSASEKINVTDTRNQCYEANYEPVPSNSWKDEQVPVYNSTGELTGFGMPEILKKAVDKVRSANSCNTGFTIAIPPNALVDQDGNDATGEVSVAATSIDLFSPDGMPGDYSASERNSMISYGAGSVEIYSEGKTYQLKDGFEAEITIQVEPAMRETEIPEEIPFLIYNTEKGVWEKKGTGKLNEEKTAYTAITDHLSTFNMDVLKTEPACIRFCFDAPEVYELRVIVPLEGGGVRQRNIFVDDTATGSCEPDPKPTGCGGDFLHVLYNLPYDTPIAIEVLEGGAVFRTFVVITNGAADLTGGNGNIPPCEYTGCCPEGECGGNILVIGKPAMEDEKNPVMAIPEVISCTAGTTKINFSWYFNGSSGVLASDFSFALDSNDCTSVGDETDDWIGFNGTTTLPDNSSITIGSGTVNISNAPIYSVEVDIGDINYYFIKVRYDPDDKKSECAAIDIPGC